MVPWHNHMCTQSAARPFIRVQWQAATSGCLRWPWSCRWDKPCAVINAALPCIYSAINGGPAAFAQLAAAGSWVASMANAGHMAFLDPAPAPGGAALSQNAQWNNGPPSDTLPAMLALLLHPCLSVPPHLFNIFCLWLGCSFTILPFSTATLLYPAAAVGLIALLCAKG